MLRFSIYIIARELNIYKKYVFKVLKKVKRFKVTKLYAKVFFLLESTISL